MASHSVESFQTALEGDDGTTSHQPRSRNGSTDTTQAESRARVPEDESHIYLPGEESIVHGPEDESTRESSHYDSTGSHTPEILSDVTGSRTTSATEVIESLRSRESIANLGAIPPALKEGSTKEEGTSGPELPEPAPDDGREPTPSYPSTTKTAVVMLSLYISIFLIALDRTILGPAIPAITNQFQSINDIGWYNSGFMLTACGFILLYGRVYTFFPTKPVFLSGILLFEAGSAVCGAASSSMMLIIGRAIAGFGSCGIFTGAILIMTKTVPLHRRPMLQGLFGACFGVASVAGPLLGGVFTGSRMTWRWCFYINLPLGGITVLVVLIFLRLDQELRHGGWKNTAKNLDPLGTLLFLPAITCLLLALEWGAAENSWNEPRIIAVLVVFAVLFCAFIAWQYVTRNTTATVPARIASQRSVAFGSLSQFCVGATMLTVSTYIPLWFQAIKGVSAMQSGINMIPLVLAVVVGSILSGALVQRFGRYTPFMAVGSCFMATGAGLLVTWSSSTMPSAWIGFQIILGLGVGCTMQQPNLAVQVVLPEADVPTGTALLSFFQTLGGAVFVAVGQNTFISKFTESLEQIDGVDVGRVEQSGATDLVNAVPQQLLQSVLQAYNASLTRGPFFAALIIGCLGVPAAFGMEWRSVKESIQPKQDVETSSSSSSTQAPSGTAARSANESLTGNEPTANASGEAEEKSGTA